MTELYTRVKGARGEWRGAVLGALYGLVECTSPKILVSVARVVLVVSTYLMTLTRIFDFIKRICAALCNRK